MTDYAIVEAMRKLGGGFFSRLADAMAHADPVNMAKLKAAFPDEWAEFEDLARLRFIAGKGPK